MVVCKFFQQGTCRYGQNCAYEHVYGSKYNYYANQSKPQQTGVTDEELVNQVQSDVQAVLKGGQWILSSYAPFKEKPTFPGLTDLSPEEARLFIYEAKSNNNLDQAISYITNIVKDNHSKYEQLLQPNANIVKTLRSLYKGESPGSPFTSTQNPSSASNPSSLFRSAVQNTSPFNQNATSFSQNTNNPPSIFSTNNSIFSPQNNQNVFNQNQNSIFSQPEPSTAAKSIFSQATQNIFGPQPTQNQSVFNTQSPSNLFSTANQSIFGPQEPQASPFLNQSQNTNVFQITDPFSNQTGTNIFQKSDPSRVGPNIFQQAVVDDGGVYSKMEDLPEEDLEAYKNDEFVLGYVPEIPPPHSLCF